MSASNKTVDEIIKVVQRHVDRVTLRKIIIDLSQVSGNKSFQDTIAKMAKFLDEKLKISN